MSDPESSDPEDMVASDDEEVAPATSFDIEMQLLSEKYTKPKFVRDFPSGEKLTYAYLAETGFEWPMMFRKPDGLGMTLPPKNFTVRDVERLIGGKRVVDLIDCRNQQGLQMTFSRFVRYFERRTKRRILNLLSLEFGDTALSDYVSRPSIVNTIDHVTLCWPVSKRPVPDGELDLAWPKVQKYCLVSPANSYTDFHVDFGGTSVWYHVHRGEKIFWFIPPTKKNLELFEKWTLSGAQDQVFFGDKVDECQRIRVQAGETLFIPSGWIHAVFTPVDCINFGGNFLHGLSMKMQVRVVEMEEKLKVPNREKFPHFWPLMWYVMHAYSQVVTSRHKLAPLEIKGLKKLYKRLSIMSTSTKYCPASIDSHKILACIKKILSEHIADVLPKNILMPTIIHYTHEEPPAKVLKIEIPKPKILPSVMVILPSEAQKLKPTHLKINGEKKSSNANKICHNFPEEIWGKVFSTLCTRDRAKVAQTCKAFHRFVTARTLWRHVDLSHLDSLTPSSLKWLMRRAPESVSLPTSSSYRQTAFLLSRSPMLRKLILRGASWSAISAINTGQAPPLRCLDLSWSVVTDAAIEEMTSCPTGNIRMGTPSPSHSRLMKLQELILDGADISDDAMFHLSKLPELRSLSLMACVRLTADGLGKLVSEASQGPLDGSLNLSNCSGLQVDVLPVLREFLAKGTKSIVISETGNLPAAAYDEFRHKMDASAREKWDQHVTFQPEISPR